MLRISAKTGDGVADVLDAIVERVPPPTGDPDAPARALVFDSAYDQYRGVVAFVRMVDGSFRTREDVRAMAAGTRFEAEELGFFRDEGLEYEFQTDGFSAKSLTTGSVQTTDEAPATIQAGAFEDMSAGRTCDVSSACHWAVNAAAATQHAR